MIEANNPDIDVAALERRTEVELQQPEQLVAPSLAMGLEMAPLPSDSSLLALKMLLRDIPVLGAVLAMLNRWQRQRQVGARLLATPYLGYGLRWLKSLALVHETRGRLEMTVRELASTEQKLASTEQRLCTEIALSNARIGELRQEVEFVEQRLKTAHELNLAHVTALRQEVAEEKTRGARNRAETLFQQRRLTAAIETSGLRPGAPAASAEANKPVRTDALDSYYAAFEDSFRGSREEIKRRLEVYLDRIKTNPENLPVLDIGCGRGEWIEMLGARGVAAYGIDLNSVFVADARARALDVREAEALAHLRSLEDASLAGLTGFHIIEHLALDDLISIIDEANRVLAPGGFLLFETPNPENLIVGASTFWSDPTHRAPLPPSVSRFMVEQRGFIDAEVIYLHEADDALKMKGTDAVVTRLNQLFYGPMDYAIWARKA
ncbi:MAG: class I SAM-dependent methyltransferase [Alphaproteobacteria bacterium]|nr:class I SAM-dependent methyltransferase [Alphaproteobacteria bacterium]